SQAGEASRPGEDSLRVIRMEPDLFPLAIRQPPRLVPDGGRHADATCIVHERGPADGLYILGWEVTALSGRLRQRRGVAGVAGEIRRLQIGEVGDRLQRSIQLLLLQ